MSWPYEDIIHSSRPRTRKRAPMPIRDRAAQFAPFAALTGHDAVIRETARITEAPVELDRDRREELDAQLRELSLLQDDHPKVTITHYVQDERKTGGAYVRTTGHVQKVDATAHAVVLGDGSGIDMETIFDIIFL